MQGLIYSVAGILGRPGEYRDFEVTAPLPGVATGLARLGDRPVTAQLRAESVVEGVLVTGAVKGRATATCARCLRPLAVPVELELCELFGGPRHEVTGDGDAYRIEGLEIHLEQMLRDACALALPLNPVCSQGCKGLCATCGIDLNESSCDCAEQDMDPRWAPLAALRAKLET